VKRTEQFCRKILSNISIKNAKAFTNLVMSLSSYETARSVVQLSESALFHHEYSSIRDGIHGVSEDELEWENSLRSARTLLLSELDFSGVSRILLQTDASSIEKPHSRCLADRQYVKINNNVIRSNQPISVGYPISLVNLSAGIGKWSLPLDIRRISSDESATACAVRQVGDLIKEPPLSNLLVINTLDSGYGSPSYMSPVYGHENLVNLIRFRYGKKVWLPAVEQSEAETEGIKSVKGAPRIYGEKFYLIDSSDTKLYSRKGKSYEVRRTSIFDLPSQDYIELEGSTSGGRLLNIQVWRWNNLLVRSKKGAVMKDKSFDLIASRVSDQETAEMVFQRTMFTVIHGQQKDQISTKEAFEGYRKRYDIEPAIKFAKQKLLLDKYQTPLRQHFDNWLIVGD